MDKTYFRDLYTYTFWADRQVWNCITTLTEDQFKYDLDYSLGSIWVQCVHMMAVEYWWLTYLSTGELDFLDLEDYPTFDSIRAKWDQVEAMVMRYLDTLTPDELTRQVHPDFWDELEPPIFVWQALLQVANHSTDHRAQILAGLHQLGAPTVGQDYLSYLHRDVEYDD